MLFSLKKGKAVSSVGSPKVPRHTISVILDLEDNTSIICSKRIMNEENHIMAFFGKLDFLWKVVES